MDTKKAKTQPAAYIINLEKLEQSLKRIAEKPTDNAVQIIAAAMPMVYEAYLAGTQGIPFDDFIPFVERIEE